jgi:hypothetical protein
MPQGCRRTIAWLNPEQVDLVRQIADAAGLEIVGTGGPATGKGSGAGASAARDLGATHLTDLRDALTNAHADLLFITDPGDFARGGEKDDAASILAARQRGLRIAALEPIPAAALDLASGGWLSGTGAQRPIDAVHFCPLTRHNKAYRAAADALGEFGPPAALAVESWRTSTQGSLGASLFAAMDLILALMGEPQIIDAAHAPTAPTGGSSFTAPGETLRHLHGTLTANLRFPDGRIASLIASDCAGRWNRAATLIGPGGRLRVMDDDFAWIAPDGTILDPHAAGSVGDDTHAQDPDARAVAAIADQLERILDDARPDPAPTDHAAVLALAHAALLSARTGHPESPATVRLMAGAT